MRRRLAQLAPFIRSCFIGRISYVAPTSSRIIGSAAVRRSTSVWSLAEKIESPHPPFGIIYRAVTHDRTNFGQAVKVVAVSLHDISFAVGHRLDEVRARQDHFAQEVGHLLPLYELSSSIVSWNINSCVALDLVLGSAILAVLLA